MKKDLKLWDREWVCEDCGVVHDRDENAACNVEIEALRIFESSSDEARGVARAIRALSVPKTLASAGAHRDEAPKKLAFYDFP